MRATLLSLLAALAVVAAGPVVAGDEAQASASAAASAPASTSNGQPPVPMLWAVARGGHTVYLLGSFHLLAPGDYPVSSDVQAAFDDAESLLFELPPAEMSSPTLSQRMARAALRRDGTQLDAELPEALRGKLAGWVNANASRLAGSGITAQSLQVFEPWFVGLVVDLYGMTSAGLDPALGLDRHFAAAAEAAGKATDGFETGDEQIAFLDGMDRDEQLQFLAEALDDAEPGNQEIATLHAVWRAGDAGTMWSRMGVDMRHDYPKLYQRIDVQRNAAWLPVIERRLEAAGGDDTLVVVGSLHLLGPDGLVERLRASGYAVQRICSACASDAAR